MHLHSGYSLEAPRFVIAANLWKQPETCHINDNETEADVRRRRMAMISCTVILSFLWFLCIFHLLILSSSGMNEIGIYRVSGVSGEIQRLKKAFEKSKHSRVTVFFVWCIWFRFL